MKKIIVIDDEVNIRKAMGIILRREGYEVIECEDAFVGMDMLQRHLPACVFLDVMMPGKSGITLCSECKQDANLKAIPIVLITALGMRADIEEGFSAGANEYIIKPFLPQDVVSVAKKYC